jgi:O-antigen/teichoic acid export membrane protein
MSELGKKIVSGTLWVTIDRLGTMSLQFVANLMLARLLTPEDFGCIGMLAIFITVSNVFIDAGFGSALIQNKNVTQQDYSTIFYWNLFFSSFLYLGLFIAAPYIAGFFNYPILCKVLRVFGLTLIINALFIVQNNRMRKQLAFRTLAIVNVSSYFLAAIIAVFMAYKGCGVWALVALSLLCGIFQNILLWSIIRWRPSLDFSFESLKRLFNFGGYLLAANILQGVCQNLQSVIIGRKFSAVQMGLYSQAQKMNDVSVNTISGIIVQTVFPAYSQVQEDREKMHALLDRSIRLISCIVYFIVFLLILVAAPLIAFLYGEKWIESIPYFQILCTGGFFVCLQNINYYAVAAIGQSRALFRWSIYKWGMLLVLLLCGSHWGMHGILWSMVISGFNIFMVNALLAVKYVGYTVGRQFRMLLPNFLVGIASFALAVGIPKITGNMHPVLTATIFAGGYILLTFVLRLNVLQDILSVKDIIINKFHLHDRF